ncbi:MAG TPA: tetratricopeptide repeat protein [bacterium]|nr:tetratricopeptide repeat protein [bacterium]HPR88901.1 tetratricopeptide repeat protein [bacterium]
MKTVRSLGFRLAALLLPLAILALLEGGLRLFDLFPREPLFVDAVQEGREVTRLNPDVARRYFNPKRVIVPNLYPELFSRRKPAEVFRVFCLGGSTTAGFPFEFQVPFPAQLQNQLTNLYPGRRFEVINLGLSAISSFTVLDFIPEVLDRQPDLVVLYMGHNEFYGAYGSASSISFGRNGHLIRLYLRLQRLHLVQMIRSALIALTPAARMDLDNTTLMEQVIADKEVLFGSPKYNATLGNFRTNLGLIIARCRRAGVPVMAGTLVCNLRDQAPLGSTGRRPQKGEGEGTVPEQLARCDRLIQQKSYPEAMALIDEMTAKDSLSADLRFRAGRIHLALGDSLTAQADFSAARDRDLVRFRASSEVNRIITETARDKGAILVDIAAVFASASPGGIPGNEMICDHLHPNPVGYQLMAQTFLAGINRAHLLAPDASGVRTRITPFAVTDLDWDIGMLRIFKLLHRWPFANQPVEYDRYKPHGSPAAAQVALDFLLNHHNWVRAHYDMADTLARRGDAEDARQEFWAVLSYYPERPEPWIKIAESYEQEGEWSRAEKAWIATPLDSGKKGWICYRLALVQWRLNQKASAIQTIQEAIVAPDLTAAQRLEAKFDLAGFFIALKRMDFARRVVEDILHEKPDFQPALEMKTRYFGA